MNTLTNTIGGIVLVAGWCVAAQAADVVEPQKGTWRLNNWVPGDSIQLKLAYRKASARWEWGSDQPVADLHGLTAEQLRSTYSSVAFTLQRDAGTFAFEGSLTLGLGRGAFRFDPDPTYVTKLEVLGYGAIEDDDASIMFLAVSDISLAFASEVKFSGLKDVTVSDLVRLKDHGVDLKFIRALATIGATDLTADDIIKLHDHGVKPGYVARIQSAGYADLTVDQLIRLHDHGVD